ncbi:hypothetical protein MMYC01_204050 [Madurella mycetomatis]|uniref:Alcohol acetyltransferase FCK4 n=1 Tax=Madurella mycetomatis TaxID=100816 RepID=A0A175W775_9PEZI|nr:hypothetical protein MMYC01_204050 [Madurella mycetomatis]
MEDKAAFQRYASPNEQRTISREDLGFYHGVVIGAVYEFENSFDVTSPQSFFAPLQRCIKEHPFLTVTVADRHTDKAFYERVPSIDLKNHLTVLDKSTDVNKWQAIEAVLRFNLDRPFTHEVPPWRVVVLPLTLGSSCFIAFIYSHTILDGPSGVAFHRTFRTAAGSTTKQSIPTSIITTPSTPLPPPFDTPDRLPISWLFLLGPLLAVLMPQFLANWLGLKPQASTVDQGTWTGDSCAFDPATTRTKLVLREIPPPLLEKALRTSKEHGARLTGTLHILVTRALSKALVDKPEFTNFASQTPINMRRAAGVPPDEMGEFASGVYEMHPRISTDVCSSSLTDEEWAAARFCSEKLADAASRLQDQPIGLLRYVPSIRKWTVAKLGRQRDSSYELSNVGVFDNGGREGVKIREMVFAQPGMAVGSPLCVNVVSAKGGSLVYTMTWVTGALGVPESEEDQFVERVCQSIWEDFQRF